MRTEYNYDKVGRLTGISSSMGDIGYTYDRVGNRVTMIDHKGTHQYTYDRLYRLSKVMYPDASQAGYTYDGVGNRLTMSRGGGILPYSYNAANQLLNARDVGYEYDARGNMIKKIDAGGNATQYVYDMENRLRRIKYSDGRENKFAYDPVGRRIGKKGTNDEIVYYLHDGQNVLAEMDEYGKKKVKYTTGLGIDEMISMTQSGGNAYFFHQDGLGSTVNLSNSQGNKVAVYEYDVFGKVRSQTGSMHTPYLFTGRELDEESGLYYYRARYMDAAIGRFTAKDPILEPQSQTTLQYHASCGGVQVSTFIATLFFLLNSQQLNAYVYVQNNPVNLVDPAGLRSIIPQLWQVPAFKMGCYLGAVAAFSLCVYDCHSQDRKEDKCNNDKEDNKVKCLEGCADALEFTLKYICQIRTPEPTPSEPLPGYGGGGAGVGRGW